MGNGSSISPGQQRGLSKKYRKILIISPGLIFVKKAFWVALFSGELIAGLQVTSRRPRWGSRTKAYLSAGK